MASARRFLLALATAAVLAGPAARAEMLPIRTYTTTDGLPRNQIDRIVRDRGGFLWFLTPDGPSRFDGYGFLTLDTAAGLKSADVRDLLEDRAGTIWVTTRRGLQRMRAGRTVKGNRAFEVCDVEGATTGKRLGVLYESSRGALWVGSETGLHEIEDSADRCRVRDTPILVTDSPVNGVVEDGEGRVWVAGTRSLRVLGTDGRWASYTTRGWPNPNDFRDIVVDRAGTVWAADFGSILRLVREPTPGGPIVDRAWTRADGLGEGGIADLLAGRDGSIWAGYAGGGVSLLVPGSEGRPWSVRTWTDHNGLSDSQVMALAEDLEGNLWMGTEGGGAMRLARQGLTSFGEADGMIDARTQAIFEMADGRLCTISAIGNRYLNVLDGERFRSVRINLPPSIEYPGWGWGQISFQDREGEWWIATGSGLVRFPRLASPFDLATAKAKAVYGEREGLVLRDVFRLYEDRTGDIWISSLGGTRNCLYRWERAAEGIHGCEELEGMPEEAVTAFAEDRGGTLWLGLYLNGFGRLRERRFQRFTAEEGGVEDFVYSMFVDSRGRLWVATARHGVLKIDDPTAERPVITRLGTAEGLSSNAAHCLTEDSLGRIYVGTGQGVDRLDPAGRVTRRFTVADGLAGSEVIVAHRDRAGDLWFGATLGLSRLRPGPDPPLRPPPVWIRSVTIGGVPAEVPLLGKVRVEGLEVRPSDRRVDVEFSGLSFVPGGRLLYQYRIEGAREGEWSAPSPERAVHFASLAPGRYRFAVRALTAGGSESLEPAEVSFRVLPPIWRRAWFLALVGLALAGSVFLVHRTRVRRLVEMERLRTRIAMDLHDDVGSGLGSIAVLAGVSAEAEVDDEKRRSLSREIAETAQQLGGAMADIVWSLRSGSGNLEALAAHLAERGNRLFASGEPELVVEFPDPWPAVPLSLAVRRSVLLIAVEALHNSARHSGARRVVLGIGPAGSRWCLTVRDDGRGLPPEALEGKTEGLGMTSMRRRAEEIGAEMTLSSGEAGGTTLRVTFDPAAKGKLA